MLASQLRYNIDILQSSGTTSEFGTVKTTYHHYYSTRAAIKYNSGGESIDDDIQNVNQSLTFTIRNRKDKTIDESFRIKYDNKEYDIKEIRQKYDGVFKSLEIIAERVNNE